MRQPSLGREAGKLEYESSAKRLRLFLALAA